MPNDLDRQPLMLLKHKSKTSKNARPRRRKYKSLLPTKSKSYKSKTNKHEIHNINKKSINPNTKSSSKPNKHINAKCILQPQHKSKKVINLSRSSNDQSIGDNDPISITIQEQQRSPLKQRVNSHINKRINAQRIAKQHLNIYSKHNDNKCSLHTTLT